jgi:hypothetical protein
MAERRLAPVVLALVAVWFLAASAPRLAGPFGLSHDGYNGATWGLGSRALREEGIVGSRLGAVRPDGAVYVNHPPLILVETAFVETVAGERPLATRAAAWLATLATIPLLYRLAVGAGMRRWAAAAGVAVGMCSPMVRAYGSMLDTPMTSLPFGVAVALVWQRAWQDRPVRPALAAAVTAVACAAGWEACLLAGFATSALAIRCRRRGDARWGVVAGMGAGAAVGVAGTLAWTWWATGDPGALLATLSRRTGDDASATWWGALVGQSGNAVDLYGFALVGLVGAGVALRRRTTRPVAALLLATTLVYPVVFHNAAYYHDYWNYWWVLPIAFGAAHLADRLPGRHAPATAAVVAAGLAVWAVVLPNGPVEQTGYGQRMAEAVEAHRPGADGEVAAGIGNLAYVDSWMTYDLHAREFRHLREEPDLVRLAAGNPTAVVLLWHACAPADGGLCASLGRDWPAPAGTDFRVASAGCLADVMAGRRRSC